MTLFLNYLTKMKWNHLLWCSVHHFVICANSYHVTLLEEGVKMHWLFPFQYLFFMNYCISTGRILKSKSKWSQSCGCQRCVFQSACSGSYSDLYLPVCTIRGKSVPVFFVTNNMYIRTKTLPRRALCSWICTNIFEIWKPFSFHSEGRAKGVQSGYFSPGSRLDICFCHTFCCCCSEDLVADLPVLLFLH